MNPNMRTKRIDVENQQKFVDTHRRNLADEFNKRQENEGGEKNPIDGESYCMIWIDFDKDTHKITIDPDPVFARKGDILIWECHYPFSLHFGYESLMEGIRYSEYKKSDGVYMINGVFTHPHETAGRKFVKYTVSLCFDDKVYIEDPGMGVPPLDGP
ncbi:hypothetical protein ACFLRX_09400 [Acidobacteriota bacterium]